MRLTQEGVNKFQKEKEDLLTERLIVIEDVKKAREMGDLSENGYYKASKSRLRFIDGRLHYVDSVLKQAKIITSTGSEFVELGSQITLKNSDGEKQYMLVDVLEANPKEGKVSIKSPLGQVLRGKRKGETVRVLAPNGEIVYTISEVS